MKVTEGVTLHDYAENWLTQRDLTPKTHALYRDLLKNQIYPSLGDEMLRAITPATVRAWWVGLGKKTPTQMSQMLPTRGGVVVMAEQLPQPGP